MDGPEKWGPGHLFPGPWLDPTGDLVPSLGPAVFHVAKLNHYIWGIVLGEDGVLVE